MANSRLYLQAVACTILLSILSTSVIASEMAISEESGVAGGAVDVPVSLVENTDDITNYNVDIAFDDSILSLRPGGASCGFVDFHPNLDDWNNKNCSNPSAGIIRVLVEAEVDGSFQGIPLPEGQHFQIRFDIAGGATPDIYPVEWDAASFGDPVGGVIAPENVTLTDGHVEVLDIAPSLDVNPASLNFTAESGTTSSAQTVQACNNGNADGLVFNSIGISGADSVNFSQTNNCPASAPGLAQGACCQVNVTFSPDDIRAFSASLDFDTNANNESVALSGEGTAGPPGDITITPATHNFGQLLTNDESAQFTFTVSNNASPGSAVAINTASLAGGADFTIAAENCNGTSLAPGSTCTVTVEFAPTADGVASTTLTVSGEDGNGDTQSDTATAEGEGVSEARFSSSPPPGTVNLGTGQGGATLSTNVVISNDGNETLTVDGCVISDPDSAFTFTPNPVTFSIEGGASDTLSVSCDVPEVGSVSAGLTCDTNDPNNASVSYTFTCNSRPLVVPTMQPWGLILLSLMMLAIGGFSIRFFRAS